MLAAVQQSHLLEVYEMQLSEFEAALAHNDDDALDEVVLSTKIRCLDNPTRWVMPAPAPATTPTPTPTPTSMPALATQTS